jgi:hypothetical protein
MAALQGTELSTLNHNMAALQGTELRTLIIDWHQAQHHFGAAGTDERISVVGERAQTAAQGAWGSA